MLKKFLFTIIISTFLISCGENYKEISKSEFSEQVLPKVDINKIEIENYETIMIYTDEKVPYRMKIKNSRDLQRFVNVLRSDNQNISIVYTSNDSHLGLFLWQSLYLIFPLLLLSHLVLLWVALKKIIKSETDNLEKILNAIVSIFFPFFGPIIYLTTKPKRSV